jgi:hypothetical protein
MEKNVKDLLKKGAFKVNGSLWIEGGRYRKGRRAEGQEAVSSFRGLLVFVELYVGLFVLAAAVFVGCAMSAHAALGHPALAAVFAVFIREAPGKEFAHAVVQMDGGPHGGGKVNDG